MVTIGPPPTWSGGALKLSSLTIFIFVSFRCIFSADFGRLVYFFSIQESFGNKNSSV